MQLHCQRDGNALQTQDEDPQKAVYALSQHPIWGAVLLTATIHRSGNQGVEMGVAPLYYL